MWVIFFVSRGIGDLKILNSQARHIVHWYFEVHGHWPYFFTTFSSSRFFQSDLGNHHVLVPSLELFDGPLSNLFLWFVLKRLPLDSLGNLVSHILRGSWHWESNNDLSGEMVLGELSTNLHLKLKFIS